MPVLGALVSNETTEAYATTLAIAVFSSGGIVPAFVMSDDSTSIAAAVAAVFNRRVRHLLCHWHVSNNLVKQTNSHQFLDASVNHDQRTTLRGEVEFLLRLRDAQAYERYLQAFCEKYSDDRFLPFVSFYLEHYHRDRERFAWHRRLETDPNTNNILESKCNEEKG